MVPPLVHERPETAESRLARLRRRLAGRDSGLSRGLLMLLSRDRIDEQTWEDFEDVLITSDLGVGPTTELVERLRTRFRVEGVRAARARRGRSCARSCWRWSTRRWTARSPPRGRTSRRSSWSSASTGPARRPRSASSRACSWPRTRTCCSAPRTRSAPPRPTSSRPGATGSACRRSAARRAPTRPASRTRRSRAGVEQEVDVVIVDTAGRLHTKTGLMDELGKVKRVVERQAPVGEVLLVLDATTGQNGLIQARIFREVVQVTGIVLTKLDGSAKGGIVVQVQRELGRAGQARRASARAWTTSRPSTPRSSSTRCWSPRPDGAALPAPRCAMWGMSSTLLKTGAAVAACAALGSVASRDVDSPWYTRLAKPGVPAAAGGVPDRLDHALRRPGAHLGPRARRPPRARRRRADRVRPRPGRQPGAEHGVELGRSSRPTASTRPSWSPPSSPRAASTSSAGPGGPTRARAPPCCPYPGWCAFATVLSAALWRRNRG